jgi:hypothetical protein
MTAGLRWEYGPSRMTAIVGNWGRWVKGETLLEDLTSYMHSGVGNRRKQFVQGCP